jgi:hypothetical protein
MAENSDFTNLVLPPADEMAIAFTDFLNLHLAHAHGQAQPLSHVDYFPHRSMSGRLYTQAGGYARHRRPGRTRRY